MELSEECNAVCEAHRLTRNGRGAMRMPPGAAPRGRTPAPGRGVGTRAVTDPRRSAPDTGAERGAAHEPERGSRGVKAPKSASETLSPRASASPVVENTAAATGRAVALDMETRSAPSGVSCALLVTPAFPCASLAVRSKIGAACAKRSGCGDRTACNGRSGRHRCGATRLSARGPGEPG